MIEESNQISEGKAISEKSLAQRAVGGVVWTVGAAVAGKVVSFAAQLALAKMLFPEDFGLVAMTLSVAGVVSGLAGTNLGPLLIQRRHGFPETAGQAFWLGLMMNLAGAAVLLAAGPIAAWCFGQQSVRALVWVLAAGCPFMALHVIYGASLARDLKFGAVSRIQITQSFAQNALALLLAAAGFGAYALVLPIISTALLGSALNRVAAGRIPIPRPAVQQWWPLLKEARGLMLTSVFNALWGFGPSLAIGLVVKDAAVTGFYYWGYGLAFQAIYLLATNLQGVLFPTLSKLNEDEGRQFGAFRRAAAVLGLAGTLVCVLQVILAEPLIGLVFHAKWTRAIPVVQWLSLGILTQPLCTLSSSLLLARGRFHSVAMLTAASGLIVTTAAAFGGLIGQEAQIAGCAGVASLITNVAWAYVAYKSFGKTFGMLLGEVARLIAVAAPAITLGWVTAQACAGRGEIFQTTCQAGVSLAVWLGGARLFMGDTLAAIWKLGSQAAMRMLGRDAERLA